MNKLLKEQWSRLAFGKGNTSINESGYDTGGAPEGPFQEAVLQALSGPSGESAGWYLTLEDWAIRHLLVDMGIGELDPETIGMGSDEGILGAIPGTNGVKGIKNQQTGVPIGIMRPEHYAANPHIAIAMLQRVQAENPRAYDTLEKRFMKKYEVGHFE
jgi:hypothetical protein